MAKKEKKYVKTAIDDIDNLNARHFVELGKEKAINELLLTFKSDKDKDRAWATKAFDTMKHDVEEADKPEPDPKELEAKTPPGVTVTPTPNK